MPNPSSQKGTSRLWVEPPDGQSAAKNKKMEMTMRMTSSAPAPQGLSGQSLVNGLVASVKRWWTAYITWRLEQAAIADLWSMSDRALKDIGLTRSGVPRAVKAETAADRAMRRHDVPTDSDSCRKCGSPFIVAPCRLCKGTGQSLLFLKCKNCVGTGKKIVCPNFLSHLRAQSAS